MERNSKFATVLTVVIALAGCGGGDSGGSASPLAAKVNGDTISVAQVGAVFARGAAVTPEQLKKSGPQALEQMIDQQLLVQKALETKIDREAPTALVLENARKQVLAQAYMDKALASVAKPTPEEVRAFYEKSPLLFAQRRIYRFQEIGAVVPDEKFDDINKFAQKAKSMKEIAAVLSAQNIPFKTIDSTKSAEEMPMELLPGVAKMNDGQIVVLRSPGRVAILQLVQSQQAPLDLLHATAQIEQFLTNGKRMDAARTELKKLRDAAKIEYAGDFVATKPGAAADSAPAK